MASVGTGRLTSDVDIMAPLVVDLASAMKMRAAGSSRRKKPRRG